MLIFLLLSESEIPKNINFSTKVWSKVVLVGRLFVATRKGFHCAYTNGFSKLIEVIWKYWCSFRSEIKKLTTQMIYINHFDCWPSCLVSVKFSHV